MSGLELAKNHVLWTGFELGGEILAVALPNIPSVSGVTRLIKSSDKLKDALKFGVIPYNKLESAVKGTGLHRYHIMPKMFRKLFGYNANDMFCLVMEAPDLRSGLKEIS